VRSSKAKRKGRFIGSRGKTTIRIIVLSVACAGIIWHVIHAHDTGIHARMYDMIAEGKGWISVLYNIGLVTLTATLLGLLMSSITGLLTTRRNAPADTTAGEGKAGRE